MEIGSSTQTIKYFSVKAEKQDDKKSSANKNKQTARRKSIPQTKPLTCIVNCFWFPDISNAHNPLTNK